ncbi:XRE family transcriptional regulator [Seongchinamella unica]|uniref:XRE family transcriptional regulator n=1 Tax=Seongchinamella unica TaxID=2547392 RepID=A0A4R5LNK3_9GAMM|nr:helix-turn-helix domain-containing protein [Seongchinamella unica]TDG11811.1 XRE family transcriptional regulator [Seongchinamella unica]
MVEKIAEGAFGRLLRYWRQVRKRSQEDVALEIDSSIKHISFLENGRSLPSRDIILRLAKYLGLSGRETNNLLASANYAPVNIEKFNLEDSAMLRASLSNILRGLEPYPSAIIDRTGNVRMLNRAWVEVIGKQVPSIHRQTHFNVMDMFLAPDGLKLYMENWQDVICALLVTLQQEVLMFQDADSITTLQRYLADPSVPSDWQIRGANRMSMSGMYSRINLPGDRPRDYLHVLNIVGSLRVVPDPVLMIYSIFTEDEEQAEAWRQRLIGSTYQHPLLVD